MLLSLCALLFAEPTKSPTKAAVYSALIPAGGQIYNHAYVKAGVVIGVQAYFLTSALIHDGKVNDYRKKGKETNDLFEKQIYKTKQNEYEELRTSDFWWMGITMALSVLDAYVDAHLSDFDAEKSKIHVLFEEEKLQVQYRF
ncbi:hypothetical protein MASR2M64_15630 [Candidatus Cloacimonadota bacterium]|nr:DUF5683 domain-containing protein [Candidatus Cloacimonadota bacterium]MDD3235655.1 DUF5683 domain-containing protein [Candidatus Cloacimonadota bacterium]